MRFRVSKIKCALCSCSILWFLTASVFAGVFGWSFHNWQHEMHLADTCTKLELLPNSSTATLVFVDQKEYLLPEAKHHPCFAYLSTKIPVYTTRRKLSDSEFPFPWTPEDPSDCVNNTRFDENFKLCLPPISFATIDLGSTDRGYTPDLPPPWFGLIDVSNSDRGGVN